MLWFFNRAAGSPKFIGIHCDKRPDDYKLVVLYPDGSEDTERFDDAGELIEAAKKLGSDLSNLGWEPCPTASSITRES